MSFAEFIDSPSCTCVKCKAMCDRPCWPTPAEAVALMEAGRSAELMLDEWKDDDQIPGGAEILCPANPGFEGSRAPFDPRRGCIMQDENGLCTLHDLGLKPTEGRVAGCESEHRFLHRDVARTWATDEGRAAVKRWSELHNPPEAAEYDPFEMLEFLFGGLGIKP